MKIGSRHSARLDGRQFYRGYRRESDQEWAVSCAFCGTSSGRAFNVTARGFRWTCATCGRTESIMLPPSIADDDPASIVLWQLRDRSGRPLSAVFSLRPAEGLELRIERGRKVMRSELFRDPDVLLERSSQIRRQLLTEGFSVSPLQASLDG